MEFWPDNQDRLPLYAKYGTVPGRNCTHEYHDRHQATHYQPVYYGEQQDQGREPCYWTVPGSRTGGTLQEYTNWTNPDPPTLPSSYFPFILEHQTQQHQDRDREWTASQRTTREYERGFLREGWESRWEPCSPVHYNREVSAKRSESIYRELEAWAARYSHTLPRRRRVEAELRGASQGLLETCRKDGQTGTDRRVAALQQARQSANIRESGVWDRGGRLQTPTYYPTQARARDTSHTVDTKEKTGYKRRMFSHPPGYTAPPPYNNQHKSSAEMHYCNTSCEEQSTGQTDWSQPALTKQNVSVELQYNRKGEKENVDENKTCAVLEEIKHRSQGTGDFQAGSPVSVLNAHAQHRTMTLLERPQAIQADQNTGTNNQSSSKIIEGRKFRLNKKKGRMTIFCLVSRIASVTESPSLPLCISPTNTENTELGGGSKSSPDTYDHQMSLADEVDLGTPILAEHSVISDATNFRDKEKETSPLKATGMPGDNLSNQDETGNVSSGKTNITEVNSTFGRPSNMSVKYPLWKEPSFTSRMETGSSSTCSLKLHSDEKESDCLHSHDVCAKVHAIDSEVQRLDMKRDTESEDNKGLLVIDTSCVVVKMEVIPSPKKEQVQFYSYTPQTENNVTSDQSAETKSLQINDKPATDPHSGLTEERSPKNESEASSPCIPSSSLSESLEERARRILGIPLCDCLTEEQPGGATSFPDMGVEKQEDKMKQFLLGNYLHDAVGQITGDPAEEQWSKNHLEVDQTEDALCVKDCDEVKDQQTNEECEHCVGTQEQVCEMSEERISDSQDETDVDMSKKNKMTEDDGFETISENGKTVHRPGDNQPPENDPTSRAHSETSSFLNTPPEQKPPPLPSSIEPCPTFIPFPDPPLLHLTYQTSEATSTITVCTTGQGTTARVIEDENFAKNMTKKLMSVQQCESYKSEFPACVEQGDVTTEQQMSNKEEKTQKEIETSPDLLETICQDNMIDSHKEEINIMQEVLNNGKEEEVSCFEVAYLTEEQSHIDADGPAGLLEQTISQVNTKDCHAQTEIEILQDNKPQVAPLGINFEIPPSPADVLSPSKTLSPPLSPKSDIELVSLFEMDFVCPSELNPTADTGTAETTPSLYLGSAEESLIFPSYFSSQSNSNLQSCTLPSQEEDERVFLDLPHREESQYPKSLWEAVYRIRKHTAPDSENEEEEVSELWDPESLGQDLGCPDVAVDLKSVVFDKLGQQELSTDGRVGNVEVGQIQRDTCHTEPSGRAEDDTMSCSSTSSHSSGDTVIVAEEDEAEVTALDGETDSKTETDEEQEESHLSEGFKGEVEDVTVEDVERTATEQKENEDIFTPVVPDDIIG